MNEETVETLEKLNNQLDKELMVTLEDLMIEEVETMQQVMRKMKQIIEEWKERNN